MRFEVVALSGGQARTVATANVSLAPPKFWDALALALSHDGRRLALAVDGQLFVKNVP